MSWPWKIWFWLCILTRYSHSLRLFSMGGGFGTPPPRLHKDLDPPAFIGLTALSTYLVSILYPSRHLSCSSVLQCTHKKNISFKWTFFNFSFSYLKGFLPSFKFNDFKKEKQKFKWKFLEKIYNFLSLFGSVLLCFGWFLGRV